MTNPLVAQRQSSTTWHSGINLLDDAAGVYDGVSSGNWIEGGLSAFGVGMDLLTVAMNPVGTLISYGLNWLIEHVQPLQDALNQLAGDADQIQAYSKTWGNIGSAVGKAATDLTNAVKTDTANWTGAAADAYRATVTDKINSLNAAATCANTISTVVEIVGVITAAVRMIVRDMVTQAIGDFIQDALEEVCSLGLGTPVVVAQVVEQVSEWITKITGVIKKLINSVEALRPMMSKLEEIWAAIQKVMNALHGHAGDDPHLPGGGDSTHVSSAEDPHAPTGDTTTPSSADTTTPSSTDPTGTTHPNGTGDPGGTTQPSGTTTTDPGAPGGSGSPGPTQPSGSSSGEPSIGDHNPDPSTNSKPADGTPTEGDPVDVSTGVMLQTQTDVDLPGILPLVVSRTHKSNYRVGRSFGPSWASTLDQRIELDTGAVHFAAADGMLLKYPLPDVSAPVLPVEGAPWPLNRTPDGAYTITNRQAGQTLWFAPNGTNRLPVTAIVDRNGNRIDFDHAGNGTLVGLRHSGGYRIAVDTVDGLVRSLRLPTAGSGPGITLMRYHYDEHRRLTEVINSSNLPMRFDYDTQGRMTRWEDRNGMWYRFTYDAEGRCVRGEGRDGYLSYTFDYDRANRITRSTNSLGHATTYRLNERWQVIERTDPSGNTTLSEWDAHHRLLSRTDPLGRVTRHAYDRHGDLVEVVRPDGGRATAEYNSFGQPVVTVDPDGATWRFTYDEHGNLTGYTDPLGARTAYTHDRRGGLATVTDALGKSRKITCGGAGLPVEVASPTGVVTRFVRDVLGRVAEIHDPVGGTVRFGWTPEGKPLWRTLPDGSGERWAYDGEGNQIQHVDPFGQVTGTRISAFDAPAEIVQPDGSRLEFTYDTEMNLVAVTNSANLVWRYDYDPAGNLVRETDFNGRVVRYRHDAAGQLTERVNGAGQVTRFTRNPLGDIVSQVSGDTTATFEYDQAGRLVRATNADADVTFQRDPLGRVLAETCDGRTIQHTYDLLGRRTNRRTPAGVRSDWSYDLDDQPVTLATAGHTVRFGYDRAGREIERQLGEHAILTQTWDANHRLHTQALAATPTADRPGPQLMQRRSYRYRADNAVGTVVDLLDGPRRFELDRVGRATAVHATGWTERYAYDPAGNLTFAGQDTATASSGGWQDDALGEREFTGTRIRRAGTVRFQHDAQGRVVLRQRIRLSAKPANWHYTWNADDQLVGVTTPDGQRWRYRYDAIGRRTAKQRIDPATGGVVEQVGFTWDGLVLAEQAHTGGPDGTRVSAWDFEPGGFSPISQIELTLAGQAAQEEIDQRFYAIVTDLVGSATEMVDARGNLVWHARSTVWGATQRQQGDDARTPLRFPGQYFDQETGLHYNYYRYYDPSSAQFLSNDRLGLDGGPNPHAYVVNPTTWFDPLGLTPYSSPSVARASTALDNGATSVVVRSRSEAEELFLRKYQGAGYRNATGFDGVGTKQYFGSKMGTYHWDDQLGADGRVLGHAADNTDGDLPHLQIHTFEGPVIRIFWGP